MANVTARRQLINRLLDSAGSTFVAVEFVKKDGSGRRMQISAAPLEERFVGMPANVKIGLSRDGILQNPNHPNLRCVWDVATDDFRNVNLDTVTAVTVRGTRFELKAPISA
jgi:hypothetical protein